MRCFSYSTCAFVLLVSGAAAAEARNPASAGELLRQGIEALAKGDTGTAHARLAESVRLDPSIDALAKLAECEERVGQFVSARERLEQAAEHARTTRDSRLHAIDEQLHRIDSKTPKLVIRTSGAAHEISVSRDDIELGEATFGIPVGMDPGLHVITARAPHRRTWSTRITAVADGATTTIVVPALEPEARTHRPLPLALEYGGFGLAAVGLTFGAILGAVSISDKNALSSACPNGRCPASMRDPLASARGEATLSNLGFAAAAVGLAAGIAGLWLDRRSTPSDERPSAGLFVGPGSVAWRGSFQ